VPLTPDIKMVSVDDHLIEPATLWSARLPPKFRDVGPRIEELTEDTVLPVGAAREPHVFPKGSQVWRFEALTVPNVGLSATAGTPLKERNHEPLRFEDMRPGAYDPVARLADMDEDGVWVQTPFPSFCGFGGNRFVFADDKELAQLCVEAYNDFLLDEWCAAAPDRYIGIVILPIWDRQACVTEIERCTAKGARGITFPDNPAPLGLPAFHTNEWDDVLSAAEDAGLPLCMHFGSSRVVPYVAPGVAQAVITTLFGITLFNSMTELVFSQVFHRHPKLQVAYAEGGVGWFPYATMRMDQVWETYRFYDMEPRINADVRPSDLVREHVWACFIDDPVGVREREQIGISRMLWESDYPHSDSLWPNSRRNAEKVFADVPADEVEMIVSSNARRLFRFP
jgi:predicted TIM-barrel fold metal-dependent hydrolase